MIVRNPLGLDIIQRPALNGGIARKAGIGRVLEVPAPHPAVAGIVKVPPRRAGFARPLIALRPKRKRPRLFMAMRKALIGQNVTLVVDPHAQERITLNLLDRLIPAPQRLRRARQPHVGGGDIFQWIKEWNISISRPVVLPQIVVDQLRGLRLPRKLNARETLRHR